MREKFEKVSQQVHLIAKRLLSDPVIDGQEQEKTQIIALKMDRLFFKLQSMQELIYNMIPALQCDIKEKQKTIKKLKKTVNTQKDKVKELEMKTNSKQSGSNRKFNYNCGFQEQKIYSSEKKENIEQQKYKNKYLESQKLLGQRKQEILKLENKLRFVIEENFKFENQVKSQQYMINALIAELEGTMNSDTESIRMQPSRQIADLDSSLRKQSEQLQTQDQMEEDGSSEQTSPSNIRPILQNVKQQQIVIVQIKEQEELSKQSSIETSKTTKTWWNLFGG